MIVFLLAAAVPFAGSVVCANCHARIADSQSQTGHAGALKRETGRWAFGSGLQAITYVSQADEDTYLEHGLSWYRKSNGLDLTPGHKSRQGVRYRTFAADAAILRCFQCHSTGTLRLASRREILPAEPGVRCEACHGPGGEHAKAPARVRLRNPGKMKAAEINILCGECHRMPPAVGVETNWENPWNARHQPVYLSQAECFQKSGGRLSCLTCHPPHTSQPVNTSARCQACHENTRHRTATAGKTCVNCHMPDVAPSSLLRFANHWIGIYGENPLRPLAKRQGR
ncbi:MAG: hypothetical protein JJE04_07560 [Acidobacteriia bacterium]|nr:hypothetical protein [Terriglobia bacterium]